MSVERSEFSVERSAPRGAVFLSYASQDAEAAKRICDSLRQAGIEVWFDQSELRGGDAWDHKIRRQIKDCALFVPVISANTNARPEGYFRLEWKLAVDRSHLLADDHPFLFPVVIDDTPDATARVPEKFREVQWTRLNVKDTPETLAHRLVLLLAGETEPAQSTSRGASCEVDRPRKRRSAWEWFGYACGAAGIVLALVYGWPSAWRATRGSKSPAALHVASSGEAGAPASLAQQLVARARAMSLDKYDSTADDYAAAEGLLKQALALEQNDAEIWAFSSLFNISMRTRGFDHGQARRTAARRDAEHALSLAPDSRSALFALGRAQRDFEPEAAEATFKKILARHPDDADVLGNLGYLYDLTGRLEEAVSLYERAAAADPAHAALARYTEYLVFFHHGRFAEAERCVRQSLAIQPSANSQSGLAMLQLTWKGDAEEAARTLATGPTATRNEPRTIWMTALVQLCRRAPDDALKTLDRLTDDFIEDNWFHGPKAYFAGRAHALAGRPEAARVAWESALALTNARLKETPGDVALHTMRGQLLAFLGQPDEALREARTVTELQRGNDRDEWYWFISPVLIYAALGRADDALPVLEKLCGAPAGQIVGWPLTPALLRRDPLWDKLRDDPRFQKLAARQPAVANIAARNWPLDPELKRAEELLFSLESTPDDYALAENLAKSVLARRPNDAEAVIVYADVNNWYVGRFFDVSDERLAQARRYSEWAIQLAPDDPAALAALGQHLTLRASDMPRAERLLRRAVELDPGQSRFYRLLLNAIFARDQEAGLAFGREAVARFPDDALTHYDLALRYRGAGQIAEMEDALDATLRLAPLVNAQMWKARLRLWLHLDLPGARAMLEQVPERLRATARVADTWFVYAVVSGDRTEALRVLRALPANVVEDLGTTPKAMLLGELLLAGGQTDAARLQFEAALAEAQRGVARDPAETGFRSSEAWARLRLGQAEAARAQGATLFNLVARPYRFPIGADWWFTPIPFHLLAGERDRALQLVKEAAARPMDRRMLRNAFALDPRLAAWRTDPEIVAALAEPEAKP